MNLNPADIVSRTTKGASALALMFPVSLPLAPLMEDPPVVAAGKNEARAIAPEHPSQASALPKGHESATPKNAAAAAGSSGRASTPAAKDEGGTNKLRLGLGLTMQNEEQTFSSANGSTEADVDTTELALEVGYRFVPHFELGGLFNQEDEDSDNIESDTYLFGPQARAYFTPEGEVQPWVSFAFGLAWGSASGFESNSSTGQYLDYTLDGDGTFFQFALGMSYFPAKWVALEASINFREVSTDGTLSGYSSSIGSYSEEIDYDISSTFFKVGISMFF